MNPYVAITTTVPVEIILASGRKPVDLNNAFITSERPSSFVDEAENRGFPRSMCAWVKGIYSAARELRPGMIVGVTQGDCSNTHVLIEVLGTEGFRVETFDYPYSRDPKELGRELTRFARVMGTTLGEAERVREELAPLRRKLVELDELAWKEGKLSGEELHSWLVSSSDMRSDPGSFERDLDSFLCGARGRPGRPGRPGRLEGVRLGLLGIPPIATDFFRKLEGLGGRIAFCEMARQFSMPYPSGSLLEQYLRYTYPYDVFFRLTDVRIECERRALRGLVSYAQSFCFRAAQERLLKEFLHVPVLTIECDRPGPLDERTLVRLESFLEMLS